MFKVVDVLEHEKTTFKYWDHDPQRIRDVITYEFFYEKVKDLVIFKIPTLNFGEIYVTEIFKKRVEVCGLNGFIFKDIWDSEK